MVEQLHDGLALHEAVRHAVVASIKSANPLRLRLYRLAAWRNLRAQIGQAPPADLWRNTADTIYLLENPIIREAFFPNAPRSLTAAPARSGDGDAILRMAQQHDGPEAARHLAAWWARQPDAFHVIHDPRGQIAGFYCLATFERIDPYLLVEDSVTASWSRHLRANPVPRGQKALFLRRWLSLEDGEAPGPVQAACWLDIKRTYLELRPALRRVYLGLRDMAPYAAAAGSLGFQVLDISSEKACATRHAMLDFGRASVDGWIAGLLGRELGQDGISAASPLDVGARELILGDTRVALTPKEFALLQYLHAHSERAVSRDELLDDVWGWKIDGGSNVVDALVRALRRKLGAQSSILETVRGVGYRYRGPAG
jgi:Transcriptional regulatory protein, C terminal